MKENGKMTKKMEEEYIDTERIIVLMMDCGSIMSKVDWVNIHTEMEIFMKVVS